MSAVALQVYSTENRRLGEISDEHAQGMIAAGVAKLIRSRDGKVRELHMVDPAIQDTGLEEVRVSYLAKMVNSRKTCFTEKLYRGSEWTGLTCWRLKGCAY